MPVRVLKKFLWILCLGPVLLFDSAQSSSTRLTILLANDDGFDAPGLRALIDALKPISDIIVAAPAMEQSSKGHALTLRKPIFVSERKQPDGTTWFAIEENVDTPQY